MRVLLTADPELPVPPATYGGIERIVADLAAGLRERGHAVGRIRGDYRGSARSHHGEHDRGQDSTDAATPQHVPDRGRGALAAAKESPNAA